MTTTSIRDPYTVLGVARNATAAELKKAYHKLAKIHHPDNNQGDKKAESKLKEINGAYDFLSDETRRKRYDAGEIDTNGQEKFAGWGAGRSYNQRPQASASARQGRGARSFFDADDFTSEDIINDIFGGFRKKKAETKSTQSEADATNPRDVQYTLKVPFIEATLGGKRSVKLADGKELNITIPAGSTEGSKLRLKGQGKAGRLGQAAGDAYITLQVEPHSLFRREGNDIHCDLPISLYEALTSASIRVPTLSGFVEMKLPRNANTGLKLRLRGKGVPLSEGAGDLYVRLMVHLPDVVDDDLAQYMLKTGAGKSFNPRQKAGIEG